MATYYFDSVAGSDSTGDGSLGNPWATYSGKYSSTANGDTCLFKRGTRQIITTQYQPIRAGSSAAAPFRFGAYGSADLNPSFIYGGATWSYIFNGAQNSNVIVEDCNFDGNNAQSGIYIAAQGTTDVRNWVVRRCNFYNAGVKSGLVIVKEASATTASLSGIRLEYCQFYDNGEHGVIVVGATGVTMRACRAYRNGATAVDGGHGFSARWNRTDVTSGWSLVSGTIYKRTLSAAEAAGVVTYVQTATNGYLRLEKNTGAPTTPSVGEFGVSAGELYINMNSNPAGVAVRFAWGRCGDLVFEDCVSSSNYAKVSAAYTEGHGFALDDFTEDSSIRRCIATGNGGAGFSVNRGDRNYLESSLASGNGIHGVQTNTSSTLVIRQSTFYKNNQGNGREADGRTSEVSIGPECASVTVSQCVIVGKAGLAYGVDDSSTAVSTTIAKCSITGVTSAAKTATSSDAVSGDPLLDSTYKPKVGSPLLNAGTHEKYSRSIDGKLRPNTPSIGAYEYYSVRGTR